MSPVRLAILLGLLPIGLVACTEATAVRVDERTFQIEGPPVPGGAEAPNRRLAERVCPKGFRVLEQSQRKLDPALGVTTYWTIRCL